MEQDRRQKNREGMPGVAELIDAHTAAFGDDFILLRCIDTSTHSRVTTKGNKPYPFPEELESETPPPVEL